MTKTFLVSGARGFIGAALVRRLAGMPETQVVALARSRPEGPGDHNVHWVESNLENLGPSHWRSGGWTTFAVTPSAASSKAADIV